MGHVGEGRDVRIYTVGLAEQPILNGLLQNCTAFPFAPAERLFHLSDHQIARETTLVGSTNVVSTSSEAYTLYGCRDLRTVDIILLLLSISSSTSTPSIEPVIPPFSLSQIRVSIFTYIPLFAFHFKFQNTPLMEDRSSG